MLCCWWQLSLIQEKAILTPQATEEWCSWCRMEITFTTHKSSPSSTPLQKEKIQKLQAQRALAWLDVSKDQNWCCGVMLSKDGLLNYAVHAAPLKGLSPTPSQGYKPQTRMQRVGYPKIKSTILAAQVRYLDTDRFQPFPQPQSNFQILFSFSQDVYCKDKGRKEKRKKHDHKHY